jgi:hypothetical protein
MTGLSRTQRILALPVLLLLMPASLRAAAGEGTAGSLLARLPIGARSQALGGAHGALPDSPEVLVVNPSSLRLLRMARVEAAYHQGLEDLYHSGLLIGIPLKEWLVLGGGVEMFSAGMMEAYTHTGEPVQAQLQEDRMGVAGAGIGRGPLRPGTSSATWARATDSDSSTGFPKSPPGSTWAPRWVTWGPPTATTPKRPRRTVPLRSFAWARAPEGGCPAGSKSWGSSRWTCRVTPAGRKADAAWR